MNTDAITWALRSKLPPREKLTLIALAAHAEGDVSAPALVTLDAATGLRRAALHDALGHLEAWRFITRKANAGVPPLAWRLHVEQGHAPKAADRAPNLTGFARFDRDTGRLFVSAELRAGLEATFPSVDVASEQKKVEAWMAMNASRRTSHAALFVTSWVRRAQLSRGGQEGDS